MTTSLIGEKMKKCNLSILGAGFACVDIIRHPNKDIIMLGGTAANVLTILSLLGLKTEFLTAKYCGQSGTFIENAFLTRGVRCVSFTYTKKQVPKIIEGLNNGKHFFITTCPKCGQELVRCNLPTLSQMKKIEKQYNKSPNIFFFDRISEGIRDCARKNKDGWNVYEPNSCRIYSNLISGIRRANIVKYSEDRISAKFTENIIRDLADTDVVLLIVTMGERGIKYPAYISSLDGQYIRQCLTEAQKYAAQNCSFIGAQGMLKEQYIVDQINSELNANVNKICDSKINWEYDCDFCFREPHT